MTTGRAGPFRGHAYLDGESGQLLDTWFPSDQGITPQRSCAAAVQGLLRSEIVHTEVLLTEPPQNVSDAYLRLHLLSQRIVQPHEVNLSGMFDVLPMVAWTTVGPVRPDRLELLRVAMAALDQHVIVLLVDKIPRMVDYVLPSGVRIGDADRVRLGAYLSAGTTVMHEGFVNFNAGTLGPCMIEGRLSSGVLVEANSDLGGSSSTMGTLSGGGREVIRIGRNCLVGANAGIGISLGDECTVEAGLYVTAGTKVALDDGRIVAARELSGQGQLLYRRNSQTGAVEAFAQGERQKYELNPDLHRNE